MEDVERGQAPFSDNIGRSATTRREIMDIFDGIQQIQQLINARRLLGKTTAELK
jgi:hypothetical protein